MKDFLSVRLGVTNKFFVLVVFSIIPNQLNACFIGKVVFNSEHHNTVSCNFHVYFTETGSSTRKRFVVAKDYTRYKNKDNNKTSPQE